MPAQDGAAEDERRRTAEDVAPGSSQETFGGLFQDWVIFGVTISLVPLLFIALTLAGDHKPVGFPQVLSSGELMLISVVLTGGCFGDILKLPNKQGGFPRRLTGLGVALVLMVGGFLYGRVATNSGSVAETAHLTLDDPIAAGKAAAEYSDYLTDVTWQSIIVFVLTLLVGYGTIRLRILEGSK